MSLYSALYAGVSGLGAQANAMAAVADNISNVNTIGYKGTTTQFSSLVTDSGTGANYSAGGVSAMSKALISKEGVLQASSSTTDLAISGEGFFVVSDDANANNFSYTRAGSFVEDAQGFLRNASGLYLKGWPLNADGTIKGSSAPTAMQSIKPSALSGSAEATSRISLQANLQSTTNPITGPYVVGQMASGTLSPQFSRTFDVFDAQGSSHTLTFNYVKTAPNEWQLEISGVNAEIDEVGGAATTNGLIVSGTVKFNENGTLDLAGTSAALKAPLDITWSNGAESSPITLNLGSQNLQDGMSQYSDPSTLYDSQINGGKLGQVASVAVSETGIVRAIYKDGSSRAIYQLPIATFQNPDGLTRVSGNAYTMSQKSGNVAINTPGAMGGARIAASKLEASNVDLAQEFSNMILFQRAYSASSKIITTVDEMLQEVSNLKR